MISFTDQLQSALGPGYKLDRELFGGGMSRVFIMHDVALGRRVVVKVLTPELAAGVNRDRFRREIQLAAQLQHPHIVPLLSAGEQGDLLWYTMPFIEGESLRAALERGRWFTVREVVRILHDIVDALAYAHGRGIVHRDIKPANILTQGAHALVTDFGVAKALSAAMTRAELTRSGVVIGTPAYMAPEQLAGDPEGDARIDIYALGLLAYELLSGRAPFSGASPRETMAAQLTLDPTPIDVVRSDVPRSLAALVERCLAKDPAARPPSATEVLATLDAVDVSDATGVAARPAAPAAGGGDFGGKRTILFGAVGIAVMAMVVLLTLPEDDRQARLDSLAAATRPSAAGLPADSSVVISLSPEELRALIEEEAERVAARQSAADRQRDSASIVRLADSLKQRWTDSLERVRSAAFPQLQRRVLVFEGSGRGGVNPVARAVADSLRARVAARPRLYTVVPRESLPSIAAARSGRVSQRDSVPGRPDIAALVSLTRVARDSEAVRVDIFEVGRRDAGGRQQPPVARITGPTVPLGQAPTTTARVVRQAFDSITAIVFPGGGRRGRGPPPGDSGRGGPRREGGGVSGVVGRGS